MSGSPATVWQGPAGTVPVVNGNGSIFEEVQVAAGGQTVFNILTFQYTPGTHSIFVYRKSGGIGGQMLRRNVDYTETSSGVITLTAGATAGDLLIFIAIAINQLLTPPIANGMPAGGLAGQVLSKINGSDYNVQWVALAALGTLLDAPRVNVASASTVDLTPQATVTRNIQITGNTEIDGFQITNGEVFAVKFQTALLLKNNAAIVTQTGADISINAGDTCLIRAIADNIVEILCYSSALVKISPRSNIRQTVQAGPLTAGLPTPGGATGGTTVTNTAITALVPWVVNAAGGPNPDRIGLSNANLVYAGLNVNGTMYLFNTVDASGNITTSVSSLAPVYQDSGARSVVNGQFTYNISEGYASVGNGVSAVQSYTVCVGQVTVAAGVVSAIIWYAYNGRYDSGFTNTLPAVSTITTKSHNIGVTPTVSNFIVENIVAENGYAVGAQLNNQSMYAVDAGSRLPLAVPVTALNISVITGTANSAAALNAATFTGASLTLANWKYKFVASRGWGNS